MQGECEMSNPTTDNPITLEEWRELRELGKIEMQDQSDFQRYRYDVLIKKTMPIDEHPEWYNGPCLCLLCLSYGD